MSAVRIGLHEDPSLAELCFVLAGRLRLCARVFQAELRREWCFEANSAAAWFDLLGLLRTAFELWFERLRDHAGSPRQPVSFLVPLTYHRRELQAAQSVLSSQEEADEALSAALGHVTKVHASLSLWQSHLARNHGASGGQGFCESHAATEVLDQSFHEARRAFSALSINSDSDPDAAGLASRRLFLATLCLALVSPEKWTETVHEEIVQWHRDALDFLPPGAARVRLQARLELIETLTPQEFDRLSITLPNGD